MHYLEHHTSCWQSYLFNWSILISCLERTKCYELPWATQQSLTGIFVPLECLLHVYRAHNVVHYLEEHTSCWLGYLLYWSAIISHLEGTKCYALLSVTHQLLTGIFLPLELPCFMFRSYKKLLITSCSLAVVDRDICTIIVSLFHVYKTKNAVCDLEEHISCLQVYLYYWSDLISCLEGTKCCVFHHAIH